MALGKFLFACTDLYNFSSPKPAAAFFCDLSYTPAAAELLPTLITHAEQTSSEKSGRFYYRRLALEGRNLFVRRQ